jgi:hypothetical protein
MTQPRPDNDPGFLAYKLLDAVEDAPKIDAETLKRALRKLKAALRRKS